MAEICAINDAPRSEIIATVAPAIHEIFSSMASDPSPALTVDQAGRFADTLAKGGWLFATRNRLGPARFVNRLNDQEVAANAQALGDMLYGTMGQTAPKLNAAQTTQVSQGLAARSVGIAIGIQPGQLG